MKLSFLKVGESMFSRLVIYNFRDIYKNVIGGSYFEEKGRELLFECKKSIEKSIDLFFDSATKTFDANSIENSWFPQIECNVFISHSHKDFDHILSFVGWLYECLGIKAFVDSAIWENVNVLAKKLEDKYFAEDVECLMEPREIIEKAYTNSRIILNSAIEKMIDSTECFLFIGTENSLIDFETTSPWIYAENLFSNVVRRKELVEYRPILIHEHYTADSINMKYKCSFDGYKEITRSDLMEIWKHRGIKDPLETLDYLYKIKGIIGE